MSKYKQGDAAYIVESNRFVRPCIVANVSGNMCLISFKEVGGIRISVNRLFRNEEDAKQSIIKHLFWSML